MRYGPILAAAMVLATAVSAQTTSFDLAVDVPTNLSSATRLPWEILSHDAKTGTYSSTPFLPQGTAVSALHRMDNGDYLFAVRVPTSLGGTTFGHRDLIRYDGVSFSLFLDGAANGIPSTSRVDAVFLSGGDAGDPVVSFDVPTQVGGTTYSRSDLVRFTGGTASTYFDAAGAMVPPTSNVIGADEYGGGVALVFDVPTLLGGTTYLRGQLVGWDGAAFSSLHSDPGWPQSSCIVGFSLAPATVSGPGSIPPTLLVSAVSATVVNLAWQASCGAGAVDYGIYEGALGNWYSHTLKDCTDDGGDLNEDVAPEPGNRYFLVVPHDNAAVEGSYGNARPGAERPPGSTVCQPSQSFGSCPPD